MSGSVYYNIGKVYNDIQTGWAERVILKDSRTSAIIKKGSDYEVACVRANIPLTTIPIMRFFEEADSKYKIAFSILDNAPGPGEPNPVYTEYDDSEITDDYAIYNYKELSIVIQSIIDNAWAQFIGDPAVLALGITNDMKPKLQYNEQTGLYSIKTSELLADLTARTEAFDSGNASRIKFTMSDSLYLLFSFLSFQEDSYGAKEYDLNMGGLAPDIDGNVEFVQTFDTRKSIDQLDKIILSTATLPIRGELLNGGGGSDTRQIVAEFDAGGLTIGHSTYLNFFPEGPLVWHTMITSDDVSDVDIEVFYTTTIDDDLHRLYAPINSTVDIKLEFKPTFED
jgi:hypothetical protein